MAYGNNKVNIFLSYQGRSDIQKWFPFIYFFFTFGRVTGRQDFSCIVSDILLSFLGAFAVCCGQTAGDWPGQHGSYRDLVETINGSPVGGKICCLMHQPKAT